MKCLRCHHENHAGMKFCSECGSPVEGASAPARSYVDMKTENESLSRALTDALEQQTATSEILRVMSQSPTDVESVFDAIAHSAARLCEAFDVVVFRVQGDFLHLVAHHGEIPVVADIPFHRGTLGGRTLIERRLVHIRDLQAEVDEFPEGSAIARALGHRTTLSVPLLRGDVAIGNIQLRRLEMRPFSESQISLLNTFADQAVIAIENVRLFKELEARNRDLTEALEQQTATSEILRVISSSPTDLQPVLDAVAENAARLCDATDANIFRVQGESILLVASRGDIPSPPLRTRTIDRRSVTGRAVVDRRTIHIHDLAAEPESEYPISRALQQQISHRTTLATPLLREGVALGAILIRRMEVRPFSENQLKILETFADQAVIAIENVRLFKELEARNQDLTEALNQQTATSEVLRAIAHTQTDAQPVFDTIVRSAARLCEATSATVLLTDGRMLDHRANYGNSPEALEAQRARFPRPVAMDTAAGVAILGRAIVHVPDIDEPSTHDFVRQSGRLLGFRSLVVVPMLREGEPVGTIAVTRQEAGRFSDAEMALLKTFADQAVIAIENVRLFKELEVRTQELTRSVGELRALGEVSQAISSTLDLETVLTAIVSRAVQLSGLDGGVMFEYDGGTEEFVHRAATEAGGTLAAARRTTRVRRGEGVVGQTAITLEPAHVPDITVPGAYDSRLRGNLIESGVRAILAVPMVREGHLIGCLVVSRNHPGEFPAETIELLRTFATQSALAIQNARLFREIADKSRQLEAASHHKSEFLANMSHELRTPLNAIIGFSEVLLQRMFGELNDKQDEYLKDIYASGQHLLSLINDILDLSKIEAGRMELELSAFDLPQAIQNALTLVRERALRRGIALHHVIDARVADIQADERKVKQVLLNLLSNAIKFTPEGGRIEVRATPADGMVEVAVTDTGVGIAPEDQETVFEEFRQVGTADKKAEGTGLGLALARKFIDLHGGRISVQSQVGVGSTFTFTLPVRPWPAS